MAQGGIFIFEANNDDFKNRKRAAKACASCQKRKKRCSHTFTKSSDQQAEKDTAEKVLPQLIHKEPVKFMGDLNPESVLTDLTQRSKDSPRYSRVGVWVEESRFESDQFRRAGESAARPNGDGDTSAKKSMAVQRYSKVERGRRTLTGHQKNYLQAVGALRVLPKATQDALVSTYITHIDPLIPIVDCKKLLSEYATGEASVFLIQAICLVACKTDEAAPVLRLSEDGPLVDPIPFARNLHTGLDAAMKADLEADRFTKVQIMTLMSLHNDGPGGIEESSLHLTMAIHDAQTTGLHINTPGRTRNDQAAMVWWTLWTLDKFNACLGGRPLMMADRDIDIERPLVEHTQRSQIMAVWLAMGDLLDQVIEFYRPRADPETAGWENHFPTFEELTRDIPTDLVEESQRNLLEVCYNIVGILSCRAGGPNSRSYNRRIVSADRIQQLTGKGGQSQLPPLPLVPYATSLSLTVAYRGLRDSHSDPVKTQSDLAARCDILESLHKTWWTADAMAKLGRKALKSLQQAAQTNDTDRRKSTVDLSVADAMDAEMTACKFGPFDGQASSSDESQGLRPSASPLPKNGRMSSSETMSGASDGLQVLSQVAAQVGGPNRNGMKQSSLQSHRSSTIDGMIASYPNKRARFSDNSTMPSSMIRQSVFSPHNNGQLQDGTPTSTSRMSTISNTPAQTPLSTTSMNLGPRSHQNHKLMANPNDGIFEINPLLDPFCATTDLNPNSNDTTMIAANGTSISTTGINIPVNLSNSSTATQLYNPRLSVPLYYSYGNANRNNNNNANTLNGDSSAMEMENMEMYNYNDLDNLFDGFFDLSMPTMFADPLFEGSAYVDQFSMLSNGPSGAGSVDMSYTPNNNNNNNNTNNNISGGPSGGWKAPQHTQSNGNMRMNEVSMSGMNGMNSLNGMGGQAGTVNKYSPDYSGGANHWCWNEDDF